MKMEWSKPELEELDVSMTMKFHGGWKPWDPGKPGKPGKPGDGDGPFPGEEFDS